VAGQAQAHSDNRYSCYSIQIVESMLFATGRGRWQALADSSHQRDAWQAQGAV